MLFASLPVQLGLVALLVIAMRVLGLRNRRRGARGLATSCDATGRRLLVVLAIGALAGVVAGLLRVSADALPPLVLGSGLVVILVGAFVERTKGGGSDTPGPTPAPVVVPVPRD